MAALGADVFSSKQFVFVVGENKAAINVHGAIIAKQSKALDALINGSMAEASDGKANLGDVQEDTFVRFCQFAYTGNYITPEFTRDLNVPDDSLPTAQDTSTSDRDDSVPPLATQPEPEQVVDGMPWDAFTSKKSKKPKKPTKSRLLRNSFDDKHYDVETIQAISATRCEVRPNSDCTEDYTTVLLGHAQVYAFAEKWGIETLKTLALHKLHQTLASFTLYAVRRPDLVELLRFAYSDENTPDRDDVVDDLRSLVMLYAVCEAESLTRCPDFLSLVAEGGPLAEEFVQLLMKRVG